MRLFARCVTTTLFVCSIGVGVTTQDVQAQYFGRNRVQYEDFNFEVLKTEHFDIHYYPGVDVEMAALMAERWYQRLSRLLDHELSDRQTLILYAAHPHFRQTNALGSTMDESTQGVTELMKRRIVLPFLGPLQETDHVIGHELVHAFQFDMTGEGGGTIMSGVPGAARMPLWFVEGIAEYLSVGNIDPETAMWMRAFVERDLPIDKIGDDRALHPYQHGQALMAYIAGRWGDEAIARLLKSTRSAPNAGLAFQRILRIHPDSLMSDWYEAMRGVSEPLLDQTADASAYGTPILGKASGSGEYNIAPALSPDGNELVFLSEKDLFAIEMFLSNAVTGDVKKKIVKTSVDPYFEGVQFVQSAGAWDFSGGASRRFAFAAIRKGQPVISIMDTETGRTVQEAKFDDLGEIFNPSWSPDGRYLVFSAIAESKSDLFLYDLQTEERRRLTNDHFGDLQPVWSPDGRTIAFVSERFTTGLTSLMYGNYGLAMLDMESGAIREVQAFDNGKHINPQWSPDGNDLYFISDQNGISNVYRLHIETGAIYQVTNLYTGVAGIAPLSPAMSVAAKTGEMAISVFRNGSIEIYRIDDPDVLAGGPVIASYQGVNPAILPPVDRVTNEVVALIDNPFFGLPDDTTRYTTDRYHGGLGLDYVGQPSLVVGADRFGTFIGGGTSLFWSDILGGRNLATMFQINGGLKDISAMAAYTNMSKRLNWGVTLQQLSYAYNYYNGSYQTIDQNTGQPVYADQYLRLRQISRELGGIVSYPFSRVHRVELSAGLRNLAYDYETRTNLIAWTGELVDQIREDLESPDPLYLGVSSLALVYDNSFFGITSPILGQRYRLEASPIFGSLDMVTGLVDFRKYVMPLRPFTLAGRILHIGRYGSGGDDERMRPMFLGYPSMVRGYDYSSFSSAECNFIGESRECPVFDQLWGSKIIVGNVELRFPPLGVLGIGNGFFGYLPLEMSVFADGGLAWSADTPTTVADDNAFFMGGDRKPVYSAGVSFKFNLFGYFILGMDIVRPFSRPGRGWITQFNMVPGF